MVRHHRLGRGAAIAASLILAGCGAAQSSPLASPSDGAPGASPSAATPGASQPSTPVASAPTSGIDCGGVTGGKLVIQSVGSLIGQAEQVAYKNPFAAACGIEIETVVVGADLGAQLEAQNAANNIIWDVVIMSQGNLVDLANKGYLETIDRSLITVPDSDLVPNAIVDYGVMGEIDTFVIGFKNDTFPDAKPASWADFFDPEKFPGPRLMNDWGAPQANIVAAELAAGIAPADLTPLDYDVAFAQLDKIKADLITYPSGAGMVQTMLNGQAAICMCTDGRIFQMNNAGGGMGFGWDGALMSPNYWAVVKGGPNTELAQRFVASTLDPARSATFTSVTGYATSSKKAVEFLPEDRAASLSTHPDNVDGLVAHTQEQIEWIGANKQEIVDRWNAWLQGS
jgi:putative spermidine/putrescine transport system substrate-binding protein